MSPGVIALLLATGDPDQLLRPLAGHPLVAYCAAAASQSHPVERLVVVGDPQVVDAVRQVARLHGRVDAQVESLSPPPGEQSGKAALAHVLEELGRSARQESDSAVQVVASLRPAWPLYPRGALDRAIDMLVQHPEAGRVISLVPAGPSNRWWAGGAPGDPGMIRPFAEQSAGSRLYAETGHFELIRLADGPGEKKTLPLALDAHYGASVEAPLGWEWAGWMVQHGHLDLVYPGHRPRPLPQKVTLLVMDFDGVLTDNRVWVDEDGREQVAANRSDSLGLAYLRQAGIDSLVISMETNPVVAARCRKMKVPVLQGIDNKANVLKQYLAEHSIDPRHVVYLGNDVNDLPCFPIVACAAAVADSQPAVLRQADLVLNGRGGHAAVRELCDLLIERTGIYLLKG